MVATYDSIAKLGDRDRLAHNHVDGPGQHGETQSLPFGEAELHKFKTRIVRFSFIQHLLNLATSHVLMLSIAISIVATEIIVCAMELLLKGSISFDYLLTGFIAAFLVASTISAILLLLLDQLKLEILHGQQLGDKAAKSEEFALRAIMESRMALWDYELATGNVNLSKGWSQLLGGAQEPSALKMHDLAGILSKEELSRVRNAIVGAIKGQGASSCQITHRIQKFNGESAWILSDVRVTERDQNGRAMRLMGVSHDITERKAAEDEMRIAAITFETSEAIMVTDRNGTIMRVNDAFSRVTGYGAAEMIGKNTRVLKSDRHPAEFFREMWRIITHEGHWSGEIWNKRKNGDIYPEWLNITAVKDDEGHITHYVGSFNDISDRKESEASIMQLAFYDHLTALPNRRLLLDRLWHAQSASERNRTFGAMMFLDLDNFKTINDTMGHGSGDLLLIEAARRIHATIRDTDTVARFGGDEFIVLLEGLDTTQERAAEQAKTVGDKLLAILGEPYDLNGMEVSCSVSIGMNLFLGRETGSDELLKQSDVAMYQAKKSGRNAQCFFDLNMQKSVENRSRLEADLRTALKRNEFMLYFQSRVDQQQQVTGAEVLLRWQHPKHGVVSPNEFIVLAEETGLILPIGQWVLEQACKQLKEWEKRTETRHLTLSVNISAREFKNKNFVDQVRNILHKTGANSSLLELEITESMLLEDIESCITKIRALKQMGVTFALDDFGTGFSSLSYLKRLPIDMLKIDQSFVQDLGNKENDEVIVQTIIQMGQNLGLDVIAEGVETTLQHVLLEHFGCYNYQGFLFGKPASIEIFEQKLSASCQLA